MSVCMCGVQDGLLSDVWDGSLEMSREDLVDPV